MHVVYYVCICIPGAICVYVCMCMHVRTHVLYICMYVCMYVCIYVNIPGAAASVVAAMLTGSLCVEELEPSETIQLN